MYYISMKNDVVILNISFLFIFFFFFFGAQANITNGLKSNEAINVVEGDCDDNIRDLKDHESKCYYLEAHKQTSCAPQGFVNYLYIFYCTLGKYPTLAYTLLLLCLVMFFYLLANTASQYFCSTLNSLSKLLGLSPTIAGVTLLSLGNGAPDVFSALVSFTGSNQGDIGLSSVLGGVLFVTTVVVGSISIVVASKAIVIDNSSFVRDICFLLFLLFCLLAIMIAGRIEIWGSIAFASLYVLYVLIVWFEHCCNMAKFSELPVAPLLENTDNENPPLHEKEESEDLLLVVDSKSKPFHYLKCLFHLVKFLLDFPRRLTIPDISEKNWSKSYAVSATFLSPMLLAVLWNSSSSVHEHKAPSYIIATCSGTMFGLIAWRTVNKAHPPKRFLFTWLSWGFLMSVIWAYMIAREVVSLLVSIGNIFGISPLILGLTVLAWGNSLGDLMANLAIAIKNGSDGVHVAICGCYAGPIFNILVGLGLSIVLASAASYPTPVVITQDSSLFETLWFLVGALVWALLVLPLRGMKLDRVLGIGLLVIYLTFLGIRLYKYV